MNALELFSQFKRDGVSLQVVGDNLKLNARKGYFDSKLLELTKVLKPELKKIVSQPGRTQVWKAVVDGHSITIIDPHFESLDSMRQALESKFGQKQVEEIYLQHRNRS